MWAPHSFWHALHVHRLYERYSARVFCSLSSCGVDSRITSVVLYSASKICVGVCVTDEGSVSSGYRGSMSLLMSCLLL
jgi:hypothetical protein